VEKLWREKSSKAIANIKKYGTPLVGRYFMPHITLAVFKNDKEDIWLRVAAAHALGDIGDERAVKPLEEKIGDPSGYIKNAAEVALRKFNIGNK